MGASASVSAYVRVVDLNLRHGPELVELCFQSDSLHTRSNCVPGTHTHTVTIMFGDYIRIETMAKKPSIQCSP